MIFSELLMIVYPRISVATAVTAFNSYNDNAKAIFHWSIVTVFLTFFDKYPAEAFCMITSCGFVE